jgi:hypothetical protein
LFQNKQISFCNRGLWFNSEIVFKRLRMSVISGYSWRGCYQYCKKGKLFNNDTKIILESFQKKFGDEFSFSVRFVDNIPLITRGKYKFLIQKLPINFIQ